VLVPLQNAHSQLTAMMDEMKLASDLMSSASMNPQKDKFDIMTTWLKDGGARVCVC